ncbi:MAG: 2OG-Fe dioxygenase family protein [Planctomycetota bacterium]
MADALETFIRAYDHLPVDHYSRDGNRFRRHQRFVLVPRPLTLIPTAVSQYSQSLRLNPRDGDTIRDFEPLPSELVQNAFLRALILHDFENSPFASISSNNLAYDVGLHLVRLRPRLGQPAISSPNRLHKDGEWITWIHLVSRHNVSGGESLVTDNDKELLLRSTLRRPLDTLGVWDHSVYHHVSQVDVAEGHDEGYRDVLLVDFTPMVPTTNYETLAERATDDLRRHFTDQAMPGRAGY